MTLAILALALTLQGPAGVIDGDTIVIDRQRVRIWGVQAPERRDPAGPAATRAMSDLVRGKTVTCRLPPSKQDVDRYGRLVRLCEVDGRDLGLEMIRSGNAVEWVRYSRGYYTGSVGRRTDVLRPSRAGDTPSRKTPGGEGR